ncbi:response regulator transcription factor [Limobrevibacterium gyesilva]|uniref:Response regulator transcription factor n=1 Tax=Limobrevibacterium gyesilva TaxID=2991712 RepID=A0AA41YPC2_9PROT|nr:response regulator transcription factor [Limobrevibacterium gyesilva]MCW3477614.1 response regulator transcription factor [Limobrevibacterium gyesilva]
MAPVRPRQTDKHSARLRILIVEDTATVAATIQAGLHQAGMTTELAVTGAEALTLKESFRPDIALIDLGLPDVCGLHLVERFAHDGACGVIVVTANGEETARIDGLETGADDYIVKPVALRELVARVRALHRRMQRPAELRPGTILVDHARRSLVGPTGKRTPLTEAELAALETLLDAEGVSVSREWLSRAALKRAPHAEDRSVDQLVLKLRRKLAMHGASPRTILSARRQGYVIADPTLFRSAPLP